VTELLDLSGLLRVSLAGRFRVRWLCSFKRLCRPKGCWKSVSVVGVHGLRHAPRE
jgi:hypothetical protein